MAIIGLVGPHAIGKTTACYRWLQRYPGKLLAAIADNQWEASSSSEKVRVRGWKGDVEAKRKLVEYHIQRVGVTIIDSVRTTNLNYFREVDPVIIVTCDWRVMDRVLRGRCEKNNKEFNEKYWTQQKLGYESSSRYLNFAAKKLQPNQVKCFEIVDQAKDWLAVDVYFGKLFRKLHNRRNRS